MIESASQPTRTRQPCSSTGRSCRVAHRNCHRFRSAVQSDWRSRSCRRNKSGRRFRRGDTLRAVGFIGTVSSAVQGERPAETTPPSWPGGNWLRGSSTLPSPSRCRTIACSDSVQHLGREEIHAADKVGHLPGLRPHVGVSCGVDSCAIRPSNMMAMRSDMVSASS